MSAYLVLLSGALLQVLLERRSSRDGLTRILVILGIGVTGISHTSGSNVLSDGGGSGDLGGRGEGGGRGHKGSDDGKLVLKRKMINFRNENVSST